MTIESYAQLAFAAAMREKEVDVIPENVTVTPAPNGSFICHIEDPERKINPFARGVFMGDDTQGKVQILAYFDPKLNYWQNPMSWHLFEGFIPILPLMKTRRTIS